MEIRSGRTYEVKGAHGRHRLRAVVSGHDENDAKSRAREYACLRWTVAEALLGQEPGHNPYAVMKLTAVFKPPLVENDGPDDWFVKHTRFMVDVSTCPFRPTRAQAHALKWLRSHEDDPPLAHTSIYRSGNAMLRLAMAESGDPQAEVWLNAQWGDLRFDRFKLSGPISWVVSTGDYENPDVMTSAGMQGHAFRFALACWLMWPGAGDAEWDSGRFGTVSDDPGFEKMTPALARRQLASLRKRLQPESIRPCKRIFRDIESWIRRIEATRRRMEREAARNTKDDTSRLA